MNESDFAICTSQINELKARLLGDAECSSLLNKLAARLGMIWMGSDLSLEKFITAAIVTAKDRNPDQLLSMFLNAVLTLKEATDSALERKIRYVEQLDSHTEYVRALEDRCRALSADLKGRGGDLDPYPPISKPGGPPAA